MTGTHGADLPGVDRYAIVVEPTNAYAEWARSCPGSASDEVLSILDDEGGTVYLIPEVDEDFETWLQQNYQALFEHELWAWHTDESSWPKDRSFKAFQTLFKVRFHSVVLDTSENPIVKDDSLQE